MAINRKQNKSAFIHLQKGFDKNKYELNEIEGIKKTDSYKYLGVIIDEKGRPQKAINEVFRKVNFIR